MSDVFCCLNDLKLTSDYIINSEFLYVLVFKLCEMSLSSLSPTNKDQGLNKGLLFHHPLY